MSAILDTVLGLAFLFFLIALFCSTAVETWANWIKKRAKFLLRGLEWMVGPAPRSPADSANDSAKESAADSSAVRTTSSTASDDRAPRGVSRVKNLARGGLAVRDTERALDTAARKASRTDADGDGADANDGTVPLITDYQGVLAVMAHPLIDVLKTRNALGEKSRNPARIPTSTLATVLLDLAKAGTSSGLNETAQAALTKLRDLAGDSAERLTTLVEEWVDAQMQQVTEAYKRWTKRWLIAIASVVVLGVGIDSVAVMQALYTSEPLRNAVTSAIGAGTACNPDTESTETPVSEESGVEEQTPAEKTNECVRDAFNALDAAGLPLTWWSQPAATSTSADPAPSAQGDASADDTHNWWAHEHTGTQWLLKVVGLLLTIGAAVLGAPFWFDAIGRISSLRNSGDPKK